MAEVQQPIHYRPGAEASPPSSLDAGAQFDALVSAWSADHGGKGAGGEVKRLGVWLRSNYP